MIIISISVEVLCIRTHGKVTINVGSVLVTWILVSWRPLCGLDSKLVLMEDTIENCMLKDRLMDKCSICLHISRKQYEIQGFWLKSVK